MTIQEVIQLVKDVQDDFQREEEQGLLQEDIKKAQHALAGKHACARILRSIETREGIRIIEPRRMSRAR